MRFLFGLVLGFAIGFAGALLFAPQTSPLRQERDEDRAKRKAIDDFGGNHHDSAGAQDLMKSLRKQLNEAIEEAKKAADEAEKEIHRRFEEMVAQQPLDE